MLLQTSYVKNLVERFGMQDSKPASVPMQPNLDLLQNTETDNQAEKLRELLFFESAEKKKTRKSKR